MPPITTKTSAGYETPQQTLDRAKLLANSQTPKQVATTGIKVEVPKIIPSTDLSGDMTVGDVMARRAELETIQNTNAQFDADYQNLASRINAPLTGTPLSNPNDFINRLLLNRPTDTQSNLDNAYARQAENTRNFASEYEAAGQDARDQFGMSDLQASLAETRNRIAERTNQLRTTLRDFETNAERRGVAREFVDSEKAKVQADAAAELADLAIIETAQLGNLTEARAEVDRILAEKKQAYDLENAAMTQEIDRLKNMDTRESTIRGEQLQIALSERQNNINTALANEKEQREYMIQAAANGADQGTLDAIRNSKSPQEAALLAGPWIGRLERMQANASIRASNASAAASEYELLAMQESKRLREEAIASGNLLPEQAEVADKIDSEFRSEPVVKEYNLAVAKRGPVLDIINTGVNGVQDLLLVYEFMKSVDPTSVVRESEFDNAARSGNIFAGQYTKFNNGYFGAGGFLPPNVKSSFLNALNASYATKVNQYNNLKLEFGEKINRRIGVSNGSDFLTGYENAAPIENTLPFNDETEDPLGVLGDSVASPTNYGNTYVNQLLNSGPLY